MSKHRIADEVESAVSLGTKLSREVVLRRAAAPAILGTAVQFLVNQGWLPTGMDATLTNVAGWSFAVVATLVGWLLARRKVTPADPALRPTDVDGQRLVPETASAAAPGASTTSSTPAPAAAAPGPVSAGSASAQDVLAAAAAIYPAAPEPSATAA